jgi:hypothetical protein
MGPATPHPWLQVDPRAHHNVFYSFPPIAHGGARPSIVARLDASSLGSDERLDVHLARTSASSTALAELRAGTIDNSKASLVVRLHARTPRDMLLCFLGAFADVLLFEAATVADACQLALEWTRRAIQTGGPLPVAMFRATVWEGPCSVSERIFDQQNALHLHTENVYRVGSNVDVSNMRLDDCSKIESRRPRRRSSGR